MNNQLNNKAKLQENLRFFIEQMIMRHNIDGIKTLKSFTVNLDGGAVKSVRVIEKDVL